MEQPTIQEIPQNGLPRLQDLSPSEREHIRECLADLFYTIALDGKGGVLGDMYGYTRRDLRPR